MIESAILIRGKADGFSTRPITGLPGLTVPRVDSTITLHDGTEGAVRALGRKIGEDLPTGPQVDPDRLGNSHERYEPGADYVWFTSADVITANFSALCTDGVRDVSGVVSTWSHPVSGTVACTVTPPAGTRSVLAVKLCPRD